MAGKSAIIRAVKKVTFNRPGGYDKKYHSDFAKNKTSSCKLIFDDGFIEMANTKKGLTYNLNGEVYRKFGTKIPNEIKEFIALDENNFSFQSSNPFDIHKTSNLTREINSQTKLDVVTVWIKTANKKISDSRKRISFLAEEINKKRKDLNRFKDLPRMRFILDRIKRYEKQISSTQAILQRYKQAKTDVDSLKIRINKTKKQIEVLEKYEHKIIMINAEYEKYSDLLDMVSRLSDLKIEMKETTKKIKKVKEKYISELGDTCEYCFSPIKNKQKIRRTI